MIKLGNKTLKPHGIQKAFVGLALVYQAIREAIATGVSPLSLVNALARPLKSLTQYGKCVQPSGVWNTAITQYGKCVQSGTPTPVASADILCNNGAIKYSANMANVNEQTALVGYYISAQGTILADIYNWFYQDFVPCKPNTKYTLSLSSPVYYMSISEYSVADDSGFIVRKAGSAGSNTNLTITTSADTNFIRFGTNIDRAKVTLERVLAIDWMLNLGDAAMDYQPYVEGGIYTDGTSETLTISSENFLSRDGETTGKIISSTGIISENSNYCISAPFALSAGEYVCTWNVGASSSRPFSVFACEADGTPKTDGMLFYQLMSEDGINAGEFTVPQATLVVSSYRSNATDLTISEVQTITDIPRLLSVGDYADAAELIQGIKTCKVGIKIFDGTETFTVSSSGAMITTIDDVAIGMKNTPMNTHFALETSATSIGIGTQRFGANGDRIFSTNYYMKHQTITTVADFKVWLAGQYANGTPVIMLYPLATETTEQTTAYPQLVNVKYITASVTAEVSDIQVSFATGEQTTPNPYSPLPIVCNNGELKWNGTEVVAEGTPEVLTVSGQNLVDLAAVTNGYYYDQNGVYTAIENARLTDYIPVRAGITYTIAATGAQGSSNVRCNLFDAQREWLSQTYTVASAGRTTTKSITPAQDGYLRISANYTGTGAKVDWSTLQVVVGEYTLETMPPYQAYVTPQTASVVDLFSVGDYKDEQEIISGAATRKVGIYVFDGTESWIINASSGAIRFSIRTIPYASDVTVMFCNILPYDGNKQAIETVDGTFNSGSSYIRFAPGNGITTVKQWKQFLADQYANGTPVIVVYPLTDETTEQVAGQPLHTGDGTTIISVTSEVGEVELRVEYVAEA